MSPILPPPAWKEGKLTMKIPLQMINLSKESFSFSAIGKFASKRPSLKALELWVQNSWWLSRSYLISLTEKGNFLFRFNSSEDRDSLVLQSAIFVARGQDECSWPAVTPVWIRLKGIPYHCWSSDILLSIASSIGKPIRLDETTTTQRMMSFARILVNLDLSKPYPNSVSVALEGDTVVEVEVLYENIPCSSCLSAGHLVEVCPFSSKPVLLKSPSAAALGQPTVSQKSPATSSKVPNAASTASVGPLDSPLDSPVNPSVELPALATQPHSPKSHSSLPPIDSVLAPLEENLVLSLLTDLIYGNMEKIPAPFLDCSNPFSILENCSLVDPPFSYSL
ncbi:hypothetical protein MRB53_028375 [Persea americana]|uniref:Uncharacterized protein n=1 Tax=Persea americana TaxID=3435 RepID=A0ACC2KFJ3_PERAE|nr:hypothetical protein MRB53_028375 [Persea americana]